MNVHMTKPTVKLLGEDGNAFSIIAHTRRALLEAGRPEQASQFSAEAFGSKSYDALLQLVVAYCDVV